MDPRDMHNLLQNRMQWLNLHAHVLWQPNLDPDAEWAFLCDPFMNPAAAPAPRNPPQPPQQLVAESSAGKEQLSSLETEDEDVPVEDDPFPITSSLTFNDLHPWLVEECVSFLRFTKLCPLRRVSRWFNSMILDSSKLNDNIVDSYENYNKFICYYDRYLASTYLPVRSLIIYEKVRRNKQTQMRLVIREWRSPKANPLNFRQISQPNY
ncbi:hypothetical protein RvY_10826 [Ramazzottius varieornatus]|uniref:F-box domain-containing protein n=1 Tax=Ramazzottius varieornatus TaxID=947166 RepID=A0A1D1VE19_RAMVA|nr:hypothetical protein RvY_10826 [Ramazzottius varieornatus]